LQGLLASCPNFEEPFPSQVRSPVGVEAFQNIVATLEGLAPIAMIEKTHELLSLCNEFGITGLLSQIPDFISVCHRGSGVEEQSFDQDRIVRFLQKEVVNPRERSRDSQVKAQHRGRGESEAQPAQEVLLLEE
jgi:hypothetical protein